MALFKNKTILITGGTDGIGASSAILLSKLGARVIIIGRSEVKAKAIIEQSIQTENNGRIEAINADFSLMNIVKQTAHEIASLTTQIDIIIHAVGILITRAEYTSEGIEKDLAVSYLSRFVLTEELHQKDLLKKSTIMLNIAASSPKVPSFAQMEFNNLKEVEARTGMKSHGQAQLANDLYTAIAAKKYGITTIGYGPGSVDTNIRREVPKIFKLLMKPIFYFFTRKPEEVAKQFVEILSKENLESGKSYFFNKKGQFEIASFIDNEKRQSELLATSFKLLRKASDH